MSDLTNSETFASGRYSKRKRTPVQYVRMELDDSDSESDLATPKPKKPKAKTPSRPLPKLKVFPFMQLPAEIRNMIYTYALTDPCGINLVATFKHKRRTVERVSAESQSKLKQYYHTASLNDKLRASWENPVPLIPSLLAVSKQIHAEARSILYDNEFVFADTFALYNFLINYGTTAAAKDLKKMRLLRWGHGRAMNTYNHACFSVLAWAENLTSFHIDTTVNGYYRSAKSAAEKFYRDAFPWLEAVARKKGKADAAAEVLGWNVDAFTTRRWNGSSQVVVPGEKNIAEFKDELNKLLGAQQQRVMAPPKSKRRKISKGDEE